MIILTDFARVAQLNSRGQSKHIKKRNMFCNNKIICSKIAKLFDIVYLDIVYLRHSVLLASHMGLQSILREGNKLEGDNVSTKMSTSFRFRYFMEGKSSIHWKGMNHLGLFLFTKVR